MLFCLQGPRLQPLAKASGVLGRTSPIPSCISPGVTRKALALLTVPPPIPRLFAATPPPTDLTDCD